MIHIHQKQFSGATYSQQLIKDRNETLLFNLVRKLAPISRADLARHSGLSPATVTVLMEELLDNQWIRELPPAFLAPQRGRRPILLEVNAARGYVATVEILSRGYICTLYDICLHCIGTFRSREKAATSAQVCKDLEALAAAHGVSLDRLLGIHVLYPGLFDTESGRLGFSAVIDPADSVDPLLMEQLSSHFPDTHCMLSNNSTAMAYSVFSQNTAVALPLLALAIDEGISAGIVTPDRVCTPLEAGHIILCHNGEPCQCGNRGCLETVCSTPALFQAINRQTDLQLEYQTTYGAECNRIAISQVAAALDAGDEKVCRVVSDFARSLCCGIISMVNLLAIRSVYLGGAVHLLGEPFLAMMEKILAQDFQVITNSRALQLFLFEDDLEAARKAAVVLTLERLFQKNE